MKFKLKKIKIEKKKRKIFNNLLEEDLSYYTGKKIFVYYNNTKHEIYFPDGIDQNELINGIYDEIGLKRGTPMAITNILGKPFILSHAIPNGCSIHIRSIISDNMENGIGELDSTYKGTTGNLFETNKIGSEWPFYCCCKSGISEINFSCMWKIKIYPLMTYYTHIGLSSLENGRVRHFNPNSSLIPCIRATNLNYKEKKSIILNIYLIKDKGLCYFNKNNSRFYGLIPFFGRKPSLSDPRFMTFWSKNQSVFEILEFKKFENVDNLLFLNYLPEQEIQEIGYADLNINNIEFE